MSLRIPFSQPEINKAEINQVLDSFDADWLSMGPKVTQFENLMADYLQVSHAVAVTNGTLGLDLALKTLKVGPGDEVIVPAMTYFATAAAVSYQFAVPVFIDVESKHFNLDPKKIESAISAKTKAIIFIDYGGNPAEIDELQKIADNHGLPLLQDAAQSLGGVYLGKPLGAQTKISTMSFHIAKIMTSVEGGMIFSHDPSIAQELRILRNQGESGKYLHSHLGTNARMTDLCAAIGIAQFGKLEWLLQQRQRVAERYEMKFKNHEMIKTIPCRQPESKHAYFFYPILVENRYQMADWLRSNGIDTRIAYPMPLYEQELYRSGRAVCRKYECPITENFTSRVINLPIYPSLTNERVDWIVSQVFEGLEYHK